MAKQSFAEKLKKTTQDQQRDNLDRFSNADSVLLNGNAKDQPAAKAKPKNETKLIRDGFLIPQDDHAIIEATRQRLAVAGMMVSKTEVIRLALKALEKQSENQLRALHKKLGSVKKGRPSN